MVFLDKPIFVGSKRQIEPYICTSPNIYFKKKKKKKSLLVVRCFGLISYKYTNLLNQIKRHF